MSKKKDGWQCQTCEKYVEDPYNHVRKHKDDFRKKNAGVFPAPQVILYEYEDGEKVNEKVL